jgi:hypothetical protein
MNRRYAAAAVVCIAVIAAFVAGRWTGRLSASLGQEAAYPWDLHRKLSQMNMNCDRLKDKPDKGAFYLHSADNGNTLMAAVRAPSGDAIHLFAADALGRTATDTISAQCR